MSSSSKPITDQDLAENLTLSQKDRLPDWKLSSFDKNPRQGHECFVNLKTQSMQELWVMMKKRTYLKTLVSGEVKIATAEFAYNGTLYKDAFKFLERKFEQSQTIVTTHL